MSVAILLSVFFLAIAIGAPIAVGLGGSALIATALYSPMPVEIVGQQVFNNLNHFTLMAVPFFFFTAALMETGGLVRRLVNFTNSWIGHLRGGLGMTSTLTCIVFASISGSSPATVAAVGRVMFPSLVASGYTPRYAIGGLVTAGSLGILIPPSIPMVLYGFVTETSVSRLFAAGIIPGLIYGAALLVMGRFLAPVKSKGEAVRTSWSHRLSTTRSAFPALCVPIAIFIGIYGLPAFSFGTFEFEGGALFTPTEAAVVAMGLAIFVGLFVYREASIRSIITAIVRVAPTVGMLFFITTNALIFAFVITKLGVPQALADFIVGIDIAPWQFLLFVNLLLIVVGFFLEGTPTILVVIPILFPTAVQLGIDPVHFCIVVLVNIELGLVTPPVGFNLFVGSAISGMSAFEVFRAALPWMVVTLIFLGVVTYVPAISLYLPNLLFG